MPSGHLFYLMGASGVGKDSLIDYLRRHLPAEARVLLARRFITRPADAGGETHIAISPQAFHERISSGGFAMHWRSHGFDYGIDSAIERYLATGWQVVVNGSRRYLETALERYPNLRPVLITVSHEHLLGRLLERGRECRDEIEHRLRQAESLDAQLHTRPLLKLSNDGPLEVAGERLLRLILSETTGARSEPSPGAAAG